MTSAHATGPRHGASRASDARAGAIPRADPDACTGSAPGTDRSARRDVSTGAVVRSASRASRASRSSAPHYVARRARVPIIIGDGLADLVEDVATRRPDGE